MLDVFLETRELTLWQLLGPGAPAALEDSGYVLPRVMAAVHHGSDLVARPGQDDFLLQAEGPPIAARAQCWIYPRGDRVLALRGARWREDMAQVCHLNFADVSGGDWRMLAAAGINIWCLGLADGLLIGCDPSLGDYFNTTLTSVVEQINATPASHEGLKR
jgi:hypothetical protein